MVSRRKNTPRQQSAEAALAEMSPELRAVYERMHGQERAYREELFKRYPTFLVNEIPDLSGNNVPTAYARRWLRKRRCFAYQHGGHFRFPTFQFREGVPKPVVGQVIRVLHPMNGWMVMYWFAAENAWLEQGIAPVSVLDADPEAVLVAASHANDLTSD